MNDEEAEMLAALGLKNTEELFSDIPESVRVHGLNLPNGKNEYELKHEIELLFEKNRSVTSFIGAGIYSHYIPAAVRYVMQRGEFLTSYTPYQPEINQGMLQAVFEYQSLLAELTAMEVVNSSMYDGATALGEAARMCARIMERSGRFIIPRSISWEKKSVLSNYSIGAGIQIKEVDYDTRTGTLNLEKLEKSITDDTIGVYVESPNFFGVFEPELARIRELTAKIPLVVGVNPISLALIEPPGAYGADIVIGEGQPLGVGLNCGGPLLGIFCCHREHVRKMPGRIVALSHDAEGRRAFCLTLQTREQHIRRARATSNICTNETLLAVAAAAYLAFVGATGLKKIAAECMLKARTLAEKLSKIRGFQAPVFSGTHFNEFTVRIPVDENTVRAALLKKGLDVLPIGQYFPELRNCLLIAVTELTEEVAMEKLVHELRTYRIRRYYRPDFPHRRRITDAILRRWERSRK